MENETSIRAVILAAGQDAIDVDGRSILLKHLGDSSILERVVRNALEFVPPVRLSIVVGYRQEDVREQLGDGGTGSAVLRTMEDLQGFTGEPMEWLKQFAVAAK